MLTTNGPTSDSLPIDSQLQNGHFVVGEVLGQGGFGLTYRSTDTRLKRPTAIKEFFPYGCWRRGNEVHLSNPTLVSEYLASKQKFLEEARVLAQFHHAGIVQVYTFFEENNTAYMVMEYLKGKTLGQVLEEPNRVPEHEALRYVESVGAALFVVHGANLIHRDIKPDNIMLCDDGRVVLIDFGLIKHEVGDNRYGTRVLSRTTAAGTDGYAPIEQYSSSSQFGPATDIYALGATLYHLLTGKVPISATERAAGQTLSALQQHNPHVNSAVNEAVLWAMQMQPSQRPQKVLDFLKALQSSVSAFPSKAIGKTGSPHSTQQLTEARTRAREAIDKWLKAVERVKEVEQQARLSIPLSAFLLNGASEAAQQIGTADWLTTIGIEKEATSASQEVYTVSQQILKKELQIGSAELARARDAVRSASNRFQKTKSAAETARLSQEQAISSEKAMVLPPKFTLSVPGASIVSETVSDVIHDGCSNILGCLIVGVLLLPFVVAAAYLVGAILLCMTVAAIILSIVRYLYQSSLHSNAELKRASALSIVEAEYQQKINAIEDESQRVMPKLEEELRRTEAQHRKVEMLLKTLSV